MAEARWSDRGTEVRVVVAGSGPPRAARRLVTAELAGLDRACGSRWGGSELSRVHRALGRPVPVGPRLAELVGAALTAAELTGGDVDPTVGAALLRLTPPDGGWLPVCGSTLRPTAQPDGWRRVLLGDGWLAVPATLLLDLRATARAVTARRCADLLAARGDGGALVALGGCVATAGPTPRSGWRVSLDGLVLQLPDGALATTRAAGRGPAGPIVDPRTGRPPAPVWRRVTVAAADPVVAKALSVAAFVRGVEATRWLAGLGVDARLVAPDGTVRTVGTGPLTGPARPAPTRPGPAPQRLGARSAAAENDRRLQLLVAGDGRVES
ncbi:thiamine biosynthesis lipoprotein [Micromonospora pisi]|uniref:FAD:protein FMN transferase n=1 Tax=Micromonospora pisi TaxID=589240 RepID=A0A495JC81_9ACTN|nr:FAD:protein FMN transferase [Micromonospora pisi]RKR86118.1 thiamine biosynthesis lipoprotein [Micromonospora pisi]